MARPGGSQAPYADPFRRVRGLTAKRVDMGVDYAGSGPVYAFGPGVITESDYAWRGAVGAPYPGTWITERLTAGPLAGKEIYVAEDVTPAVRRGQRVGPGTVLGYLRGGLETGFAVGPSAPGETLAAKAGQAATGGDPGAFPTAYGASYSAWLHSTGAPRGVMAPGSQVGSLPRGWPRPGGSTSGGGGSGGGGGGISGGGGQGSPWITTAVTDLIQAIWPGTQVAQDASAVTGGGSVLGDIGTAITGVAAGVGKLASVIDWFVSPSHWVRIFAGIGGATLTALGLWTMTHVGADAPQAGPLVQAAGRPVTLPLGIAMTGTGAGLLFIAFHNLPDDITSIGELISYLMTRAREAEGTGIHTVSAP